MLPASKNNLKENENDLSKLFHNECIVCVCFTFATFCSLVAIYMTIGFLIGVMTISVALLIFLYKSPWKSKKQLVCKNFIFKGTKLLI